VRGKSYIDGAQSAATYGVKRNTWS